jgi:hypothetical protein
MTNYYFTVVANGVQLDTFDDEEVLVSNNSTGLFDIDKLPSDFTRQLTLPGSKRNNDFFKHAYDINIDTPFLFQETEKVECYIDISGYLLVQGYLQLNAINVINDKVDTYDITLYGSLSNFSRDLGTNFLTDISGLSVYNHTASYDAITGSWGGHLFDGDIVYPLADYGRGYFFQASALPGQYGIDTRAGGLNTQDFKPAIRLTKVIDKMFDEFGYTFESTFFSQSQFDNVYMICNREKEYPVFENIDLETFGKIKIAPTSGSTTDIVLNTSSYTQLNFDTIESDPSFKMSSGSVYTLDNKELPSGNIKLQMFISGSATGSIGHPQLSVAMISGSEIEQIEIEEINKFLRETYSQLQAIGEKSYTLEETWISSAPVIMKAGDYTLNAKYTVTGSGDFNITIAKDGNTESYFEITRLNFAADYQVMEIPQNMPFGDSGITCLDFLKGLQKKFNLVITPSKTRVNHFEIETFNDWYKQGDVKDLTQNIKIDKNLKVTPANTLAVNELEFADILGKDYLARNFNDINLRRYGGSIYRDTQNQFSQGKINIEPIFSSSPLRYIEGTGTTTVTTPTQGYAQAITYNNSTTTICNDQRFIGTAYIASSRGYIAVGDVLYWDINLTMPLRYYYAVRDNGTGDVWYVNTFTGEVISLLTNC